MRIIYMKTIFLLFFSALTLFGLTLQEALTALKENNLDIKISQHESEISSLVQQQKKASQLGAVNLTGSITQYNEQRTLAPLAPPISNDVVTSKRLNALGVSYKVTLFNGFGLSNDIEIAQLNHFISNEKEKLTFNQMYYNTQILFSDIVWLQESKKSYENYQNILKSFQKIIQKEFEYGKKAKVDLLKIESDIQKNSAKITEIATQIDILKNSLSILIYSKIQPLDELEKIDAILFTQKEYDVQNLPQIQIAKSLQYKSNKNYAKALSSYYPTVNFETTYSNIYAKGEKEDISTVALQLHWNIFDFTVREKNVQKAAIEKIESKLQYQKSTQEYQNKILEAQSLIKQNKDLLQSAKTQLLLAQKTTQIEKLRYLENQITINDYLLSFSNEEFLKANEIKAKNTLLKSQFYYEYLTKE